jgi:hypothetical protein
MKKRENCHFHSGLNELYREDDAENKIFGLLLLQGVLAD